MFSGEPKRKHRSTCGSFIFVRVSTIMLRASSVGWWYLQIYISYKSKLLTFTILEWMMTLYIFLKGNVTYNTFLVWFYIQILNLYLNISKDENTTMIKQYLIGDNLNIPLKPVIPLQIDMVILPKVLRSSCYRYKTWGILTPGDILWGLFQK